MKIVHIKEENGGGAVFVVDVDACVGLERLETDFDQEWIDIIPPVEW